MALQFNCPHCGAFYRLDEKFAGKTGRCKNAECKKSILIPLQSTATAPTNGAPAKKAAPIDAEQAAAAAFADEPAPVAKKEVALAKIATVCPACDHKFEVDGALAGKNFPCPECRKLIKIARPVEAKPTDWRTAASNRPSLAKSEEPVPSGAWEVQRKGVSADSLIKAGAHEVDDDEEPRERRLRLIKKYAFRLAVLGMIVWAVVYFMKSRRVGEQERWMEMAVKEIEGAPKPEFKAAIHRYAGEYQVRAARKSEELQTAIDWLHKSRDELLNLPPSNSDRNAMLIELGIAYTVCAGDSAEVNDGRRLPWERIHTHVRKCLDKIPPNEPVLRDRAMRMLARKLLEREQPMLAMQIARSCGSDADQAEYVGRVGIEFVLLNKKDLAQQVFDKMVPGPQPACTALWLALNSGERPPAGAAWIAPPVAKGGPPVTRDARLAYAEGRALQNRFADAYQIAKLPGNSNDQLEAMALIGAVAIDSGKTEEAIAAFDAVIAAIKSEAKGAVMPPPWLLACYVDLAVKAKKPEVANLLIDAIKDEMVRSWARLTVVRGKIAAAGKEKAEDSMLEPIANPPAAPLAALLSQAELARHQAFVGESAYGRVVKALSKNIIQPFGYAGTALGNQDRTVKTK